MEIAFDMRPDLCKGRSSIPLRDLHDAGGAVTIPLLVKLSSSDFSRIPPRPDNTL
jgi:hypothetical protein